MRDCIFNKCADGTRVSCCGLCYISRSMVLYTAPSSYSTLGSPVTFCRAQRRVVCCLVGAPLAVLAVLAATLVIRAATIQDRFQLRTLSEDDISFISPSEEQVKGELAFLAAKAALISRNLH